MFELFPSIFHQSKVHLANLYAQNYHWKQNKCDFESSVCHHLIPRVKFGNVVPNHENAIVFLACLVLQFEELLIFQLLELNDAAKVHDDQFVHQLLFSWLRFIFVNFVHRHGHHLTSSHRSQFPQEVSPGILQAALT